MLEAPQECGKKRSRPTEEIGGQSEPFSGKFDLVPNYDPLWYLNTEFKVVDAGKCGPYQIRRIFSSDEADDLVEDITHIYSYNKVMGADCLRGIAKSLNQTDFKILSWYHGPQDTYNAGVRNVRLLLRRPMQSTGKEKFSLYVYYKTNEDEVLSDSEDSETEEKTHKRTKDDE